MHGGGNAGMQYGGAGGTFFDGQASASIDGYKVAKQKAALSRAAIGSRFMGGNLEASYQDGPGGWMGGMPQEGGNKRDGFTLGVPEGYAANDPMKESQTYVGLQFRRRF